MKAKQIHIFSIFLIALAYLILSSCLTNKQSTPLTVINSTTPQTNIQTSNLTMTPSVLSTPKLSSTTIFTLTSTSYFNITPTKIFKSKPVFGISVLYVLNNSDGPGYYFIDESTDLIRNSNILAPMLMDSGPGISKMLKFANFSDFLTYWDWDNQLWISDLAYQESQLIFRDIQKDYEYAALVWSPDDLHLMIIPTDDEVPRLIYHLQTNELEQWEYECDRIAISPKTGKLATWCFPKETSSEQHAVIEWGGEIWFSNDSPDQVLVQWENSGRSWLHWYSILGWSSDGERIAYFDQQDPEGFLNIADSQGNIEKTLPGSAYWFSPLYEKFWFLSAKPIQWSKDNSKILIYARGSQEFPCPDTRLDEGLNDFYPNDACWQVVDVESGEVVWQITDIINVVMERKMMVNRYPPNPSDFNIASISDNGHLLAISGINYFNPTQKVILIVDIESKDIVWWSNVAAEEMRWGITPLH